MKIHYVSGSRADFGLMEATLKELDRQPEFDVGVIATGQHMASRYGDTLNDIMASDIELLHSIPVELSGADGCEMIIANAREMEGFARYWQSNRPDLVFVLGDRGEMLMAALAASHLGLHVCHFHGGELSGSIDESMRHAISKISHFHFTATDDSTKRLIKMGELPEMIWTVGAPGLVGILHGAEKEPGWLQKRFGLAKAKTDIMLVFHPVVQEKNEAFEQIKALVTTLDELDCGGVILRPNSDAGGSQINRFIDELDCGNRFVILDHLPRYDYRKTLANVDLLVGNTSSGIIESASFGVPFLNIGTRQQGRLRNENVVNCDVFEKFRITEAFDQALALKGPFKNVFGDGDVPRRLKSILQNLQLDGSALSKLNAY